MCQEWPTFTVQRMWTAVRHREIMDNPWDWDLPTNDKPLDRRQRPPTPPISHPSGAKQKTATGKHGEYFRSIIPISMANESRIAHTWGIKQKISLPQAVMNSIRMRTMFSTKVYNLLFIFHNYEKTELKTGHVFETYTIYYICTYVYMYICICIYVYIRV